MLMSAGCGLCITCYCTYDTTAIEFIMLLNSLSSPRSLPLLGYPDLPMCN